MECQNCHNMALKDWTTGKTIHSYCPHCGAHYHNGIWYTKEEWFYFINEQMHLMTGKAYGPFREDNT